MIGFWIASGILFLANRNFVILNALQSNGSIGFGGIKSHLISNHERSGRFFLIDVGGLIKTTFKYLNALGWRPFES